MVSEILTNIVREAGGDHLLLDARNGRGIISDSGQVEHVCRKLSNAGFTRMVNYTGMHISVGTGFQPVQDGVVAEPPLGQNSSKNLAQGRPSGGSATTQESENGNRGRSPHPNQDEYALFLTIRHPKHNHTALTLKWKWVGVAPAPPKDPGSREASSRIGEQGSPLPIRVDGVRLAHPSLSQIWQAAGLAEREMFEMLGIPFSNNTQLTPLFLDETFGGHPLRLDFVDTPEPSYAEQLLKSRHEQGMLDSLIGSREASSRADESGEQGSPLPDEGGNQ